MPPREFLVSVGEDGSRLETFLRKQLGLARPLALKALRKGWVRVDGKRARADRRLAAGERVRITNYALPIPALEERAPTNAAPPAEEVARAAASVRLEAPDLIVSAKPAGVVVHRGSGHPYGWIDLLGAAFGEALTPVGRLDRDTSGLLLLARGRAAARLLFEALRAGRVQRTYQALAAGRVRDAEGRIDLPLVKEGAAGRERMSAAAGDAGRPAVTRYRVVRRLAGATLLEVRIDTGRTHQIRAHLAAVGHPLLGDPRYADAAARRLAARADLGRLFLHAGELSFPRLEEGRLAPGEQRCVEPLPAALDRALAALE